MSEPVPTRRRWLVLCAGAWLVRAGHAGDLDLRRHGVVILLRHARTVPGVGDPPGYGLDDCASQRGLSDEGRAQAARIGPLLAARGLRPSAVRSSRWCRCLDTARLAFGQATPWPALDSFFDAREREPAQTAALRAALAEIRPGEVQAWVSHSVNITALTAESAQTGEALLLRGGAIGSSDRPVVLDRIVIDP